MRQGGENLVRQLNKSKDYIQGSFNSSEGIISKNVPTFIYKGVVIDVNFKRNTPTTSAAINPPFSVYAKIIGVDDDIADPLIDPNRIYYPPLFPMHNLCIPEIGEEVLILKQDPNQSSIGYYIGRVNDCTPLNISYAGDYIATNDTSTANTFRYGFSFDVRELRSRFSDLMPSSRDSNLSIPVTFGDVVQQGRSKTYLRQSFNRNNKRGVLEQGITLQGQQGAEPLVYDFEYAGIGQNKQELNTPIGRYSFVDEDGTDQQRSVILDKNYHLPPDQIYLKSYDPSIGETSTKTIHFIDSSIKRLGDYNFQSEKGTLEHEIESPDRSMIANLADEIYNISLQDPSGALYRQVLGEKLVTQQEQTFNLLKEVLTTVEGFAKTTQVLLDTFMDHTHALPRIDLNLEKEVKSKDLYRTAPRFIKQPDQIVRTPGRQMRVKTGTRTVQTAYGPKSIPTYTTQTIPGTVTAIKQPPRVIPGKIKERSVKQKINFEAIIGGAENPRFTAPIQTDSGDPANPSALGIKTGNIHESLDKVLTSFSAQQERLNDLSSKISAFLSNNQFIN